MMGAADNTTPTDSRSRRNRASRRAGQLTTRARSSSYRSACPHLRAPGASVPDGRTIRCGYGKSQQDVGSALLIPVTNAIESLHRGLRKIIKTRGSFPSDEAAMKLLYLALRNLGVHWKPAIEWRAAYAQFAIFFSDRLPTNTFR
jgi:hypothetical protein